MIWKKKNFDRSKSQAAFTFRIIYHLSFLYKNSLILKSRLLKKYISFLLRVLIIFLIVFLSEGLASLNT